MTPRERVMAVLNGRRPDRVPWFGDLSYWFASLDASGAMPARYRGEGEFAYYRDLGVGFYLQGYFPFTARHEGVRITRERQGHVFIDTVETPVGALRQVRRYLPDSACEAIVEHYVKDWRSLEALRYWFAHTVYEPDYALANKRCELVGENGIVLCYLPKSPFMEMLVLLAGLETVTDLWSDAQDEFHETLRLLELKADEAAALAVASPAEGLMIPENLSSEMVGTFWYEHYLRPYEARWTKRIAEAGKHAFIHMDGTLSGLLANVASAGFRVIEAVTPAPVGDVSMGDLRVTAGNDEVVLWGGIPGAFFCDTLDDPAFERFVIGVLEVMTASRGFVLGVADQVPPGTRPERIRRVGELVEQYGRVGV